MRAESDARRFAASCAIVEGEGSGWPRSRSDCERRGRGFVDLARRVALTLTRPADLSFSPPSLLLLPTPPSSLGRSTTVLFYFRGGHSTRIYTRSAYAFGGIIYVIEAVPPCAPPLPLHHHVMRREEEEEYFFPPRIFPANKKNRVDTTRGGRYTRREEEVNYYDNC